MRSGSASPVRNDVKLAHHPLPVAPFLHYPAAAAISIGLRRRDGSGFCACVCAASDVTDVVVDRHSSRVGNPFDFRRGRGTRAGAVAAFDDLLRLAVAGLMFADVRGLEAWAAGAGFDSCLLLRLRASRVDDSPEGASSGRSCAGATRCLLQSLAERHGVELHAYSRTFDIFALGAWLLEWGAFVRAGHRLRLLCWCCDSSRPYMPLCHGAVLCGALSWLLSLVEPHVSAGSSAPVPPRPIPSLHSDPIGLGVAAVLGARCALPTGGESWHILLVRELFGPDARLYGLPKGDRIPSVDASPRAALLREIGEEAAPAVASMASARLAEPLFVFHGTPVWWCPLPRALLDVPFAPAQAVPETDSMGFFDLAGLAAIHQPGADGRQLLADSAGLRCPISRFTSRVAAALLRLMPELVATDASGFLAASPASAARGSFELMCGDWRQSDILAMFGSVVGRELASFSWPIRTLPELRRLLSCAHAAPVDLVMCEFTGAVREANHALRGVVTLSVDVRTSLVPGVHACCDLLDVLGLDHGWVDVYGFPPCTHQTLSDRTAGASKRVDGRSFWGILFFIRCWCVPCRTLFLEQPDTIIHDFYLAPSQRFRASETGDLDGKVVCAFTRGRGLVELSSDLASLPGSMASPRSGTKRRWDFVSSDARDRYRSSWARLPRLVAAVVSAPRAPAQPCPDWVVERERFAVAWFARYPVPSDYQHSDGRPVGEQARAYQRARGRGDGRAVEGVVPISHCEQLPLAVVSSDAPGGFQSDALTRRAIPVADLALHGVMLAVVAMLATPLIFASTSGVSVIGAAFDAPATRASSLAVGMAWAVSYAPSLAQGTFLVGRYADGPDLAVLPLRDVPAGGAIARTPAARRRLLSVGVAFAWCAFVALAATPIASSCGHALSAVLALRAPEAHDELSSVRLSHPDWGDILRGVTAAAALVDRPLSLHYGPIAGTAVLARDALHRQWLITALLADRSVHRAELALWASQSRPPELSDLQADLLRAVPLFDDERYDSLAYSVLPTVPVLPWQPRMPAQSQPIPSRCPRSVFDLMPNVTQRRVRTWLQWQLEDLVCIRDHGEWCERSRPRAMAVGQCELYDWARGRVWDFRGSPAACGVPLDTQAPIVSHLNLDSLLAALSDYPNRRLVSFLSEGVRPLADVELQGVFVPHLTSLAVGVHQVGRELRRLANLSWYTRSANIPFWPIYFNAQGSQARKLEVDRPRRTTEGGGPRNVVRDRCGVVAWSLNDASRQYHMPVHFVADRRPEMLIWLEERGLPADAAAEALVARLGSKWHRQVMPSLRMVMLDILVAQRAARVMGEPFYLFGDDFKDFFNQLPLAPEDLWKHNIAYLAEDGDFDGAAAFTHEGAGMVFVVELRMGFGIHPNSIIAQDFSEALNYLFRREMDRVEDPLLLADGRPSVQAWLAARRLVEERVGGHQRRLYFIHTFCDDNIIGVVGVARAVRAVRVWRELVSSLRLIVAIPAKRQIGTWMVWLGAVVFGGLGLVVITKAKVLRSVAGIEMAMRGELDFDDYRALMGLLEHLRCINCAPRRVMHGLYRPHGADGESRGGPQTRVTCDLFMLSQLDAWLSLAADTSGVAVTAALRRGSLRDVVRCFYEAASDAATDSVPPGLGGFMHGMYWQLTLTTEHLRWLHVTVLEMLATGFSAIIFDSHVPGDARLALHSDSAPAVYSLTRDSERSPGLQSAHHALLGSHLFQLAAESAVLGALSGVGNIAGDAVSRSLWDLLFSLCRQIRVVPLRLEVPPECHRVLAEVLERAEARGVVVEASPYVSRPPALPCGSARFMSEVERMLGRAVTATEDGDAVSALARALAAVRDAPSASVPPTIHRSTAAPLPCRSVARSTLASALLRTSTSAREPLVAVGTVASNPRSRLSSALAREPIAERATHAPHIPSERPRSVRVRAGPVVLPGVPEGVRVRGVSARFLALDGLTERRAVEMSPAADATQLRGIMAIIRQSDEVAEFGAAWGSLDKEDHAWDYWTRYSALCGLDPLIDPEDARRRPQVVSQRLASYMLWVYPQLKGKGTVEAKPRSAHDYPLALIRTFKRRHIAMPPPKSFEQELHGLLRAYLRVHGVLKSAPKRRNPMLREMWHQIEALGEGRTLAGRACWSPATRHLDRTVLRLGRVLWRCGHRLGEICSSADGSISYLTRSSITFRISGLPLVDPSPAQLKRMGPGDHIELAATVSKPDQFGEEHAPFCAILPYDGSPTSAAASIVAIELERPCRGEDRLRTPLFANEGGAPYSYTVLTTALFHVLRALFGEAVARTLSWHSIRIGLACALHAAGCPDSVIQLICRWASVESLKEYRRVSNTSNIYWTDRAAVARFDASQAANIPALDGSTAFGALQATAAETARMHLVAAVGDDGGRAPARAPPRVGPVPRGAAAPTAFALLRDVAISSLQPGDHVMVPRAVYPAEACTEFDGAGWRTCVISVQGAVLRLRFTHALTPAGRPFAPVQLNSVLAALVPSS